MIVQGWGYTVVTSKVRVLVIMLMLGNPSRRLGRADEAREKVNLYR